MPPPARSAKENLTYFWRTHCWHHFYKCQYFVREGDYISFSYIINLAYEHKKIIWGEVGKLEHLGGGGKLPPTPPVDETLEVHRVGKLMCNLPASECSSYC